jgi:dTDP-4-dehydrorhamnose 3,5-epimerase-like enzyme
MNPWTEPFALLDLVRHDDARGGLFEILRFTEQEVPAGGQLYTFTIQPGMRRGDHYHTRKREWFTCAHGRAVVLLTDTRGGGQHRVELDAARPRIVYAGPYTAHALENPDPGVAVIVSYGSAEHHPEDPDTVPFRAGANFAPTPGGKTP